MWLLTCKGLFNFLVGTLVTQINLAQPCLHFAGAWTSKDSTVHLGASREKPHFLHVRIFTCYNLVSVASNITHHLLFICNLLPCIQLPLRVTAKTRRTEILGKFIKLCGDGPNYPQLTSHLYSLPVCPATHLGNTRVQPLLGAVRIQKLAVVKVEQPSCKHF